MLQKPITRLHDWLYPELARFPTRDRRDTVNQAAARMMLSSPGFCARLILVLVCNIVIGVWGRRFIPLGLLSTTVSVFGLIIIVSAAGGIWIGMAYVQRVKRYFRKVLVEDGIPICIRCGYDLSGQTETRCPECGQPFSPGLLRKGNR